MIILCNRMNKLEFAVFQSTYMGFSINMMKHDKYDKNPPNLRSWTLMRLHGVSTVTLINFRGRIGTRIGFGSNKMTSKPKRPDKFFHLTLTFFPFGVKCLIELWGFSRCQCLQSYLAVLSASSMVGVPLPSQGCQANPKLN